MKYPMDAKVKRPFVYTQAVATNIRDRFERVRKQLAREEANKAEAAAKVKPLKARKQA